MNHLTPLFALLFQGMSSDRWSRAVDGVKHPDISKFLVVAAILFIIGVAGVLTRRNLLVIFMSIELILNAANLNFIAFSRRRCHKWHLWPLAALSRKGDWWNRGRNSCAVISDQSRRRLLIWL